MFISVLISAKLTDMTRQEHRLENAFLSPACRPWSFLAVSSVGMVCVHVDVRDLIVVIVSKSTTSEELKGYERTFQTERSFL